MLSKSTTETRLSIVKELKWVEINSTVYALLHYSVELIASNGGWSSGAQCVVYMHSQMTFQGA